MILNALIYHTGYQCLIQVQLHLNIHQYLLIPTTPFKICHLHIRMLSSSHSKCHSHMRPRNLHIAPTQNMSSTYNAKETIYFSSHSVSCKNMSSRYFGQFQNPLIIYQIEISSYETPASIHFFKNLPIVPVATLLKTNFKKTQFWQLNLLVNYLLDLSIATYCSQLIEFVITSFVTNRAFMSFLEVSFLPHKLSLIGKIK